MEQQPELSRAGGVFARAATLTAEDARRLAAEVERLEAGTLNERVGRSLRSGGLDVMPNRFTEAREAIELRLPKDVRETIRARTEAALRQAAQGEAAVPGDPPNAVARARRLLISIDLGALVGGFAIAAALSLLHRPLGPLGLIIGGAVVGGIAIGAWWRLQPSRATAVRAAVQAAAYAAVYGDTIALGLARALNSPWDAMIRRTDPPALARTERVATWLTVTGFVAMMASLVLAFTGVGAGGTPAALIIGLLFGGFGVVSTGLLVARWPSIASVRLGARGIGVGRSAMLAIAATIVLGAWIAAIATNKSPYPAWANGLLDLGVGVLVVALAVRGLGNDVEVEPVLIGGPFRGTATQAIGAAILGVVVFGVGDASTGLWGDLVFVVVLALGFVLGLLTAGLRVGFVFVAAGLLGTWLSLLVRHPATEAWALLPSELVGSGLVGALSLLAFIVPYRSRFRPRPGSGLARAVAEAAEQRRSAAQALAGRPALESTSGDIGYGLSHLARRGDTAFATFVADPARNYYVQVGVRGSRIVAEAVGNAYLKPEDMLDSARIAGLEALGWQLDPSSKNWSRTFDGWPSNRAKVELELVDALADVYGWHPSQPLAIQIGST